ncbi:MAG: metal-sensitive transcriptional regulator, partial [Actinobacteria bacterium]|nr:metal-sensitive transcriptional regulator [Actinomycetota bacterium]
QRMIDEGKECEAVLMQLSAVRAALDRVGMFLISHRMKECLQSTGETVSQEAMEAAFEVFLKYTSLGR